MPNESMYYWGGSMNSTRQRRAWGASTKLGWVITLAAVIAGCGATPQPGPEGTGEPTATESGRVQPITLIAHRSAWRVYPESSAEAMQALAETEYPIEFDLRPLADGTLVPSHDPVADRSMEGVYGPLDTLDTAQWKAAKVRSQDGETLGTSTTWEEILDRHAPGSILFPELKRPVPDLAAFADTVTSRGLQESVVVQTFDYVAAQQLAANGLQTLLLLLEQTPDPQEIKAHGIDYVGASRDLPADYLAALKEAGLTVYVYTVNRAERLVPLLELGIDGVFTDDPWKLERQIIDEGLFDE
ncbi:glycerophosphodiester phosphodiesterase [Glutamicibacter creatinolyticus]|uniref:glycerophosphodiester phosphodiesterase n=1 Tax=Glutamicibacter creatinolyticus TaxID=162496 RepID=UPI003217AA45